MADNTESQPAAPTNDGVINITLCAITLQRPNGIARLLDSVAALEFPSDVRFRMVIVENEDNGPAREAIETYRTKLTFPIEFGAEPTRGIPYARNTALRLALKPQESGPGPDFVGFVDDDETIDRGWLVAMRRAIHAMDADVYTGPTITRFEEPPPEWAVRGGFFDRAQHPTGTARNRAYTGNVLMRADLVRNRADSGFFDVRFALTGGEDIHAFMREHKAGRHIVWVNEAQAFEWYPASRVTPEWVVKRGYRFGSSVVPIKRLLHPEPFVSIYFLLVALYRFIRGVLEMALLGWFGMQRRLKARHQLAVARGMVRGVCSKPYEEYRTIHGS